MRVKIPLRRPLLEYDKPNNRPVTPAPAIEPTRDTLYERNQRMDTYPEEYIDWCRGVYDLPEDFMIGGAP